MCQSHIRMARDKKSTRVTEVATSWGDGDITVVNNLLDCTATAPASPSTTPAYDPVISKPYDLDELVTAVRSASAIAKEAR
jgi:hypothetical protein